MGVMENEIDILLGLQSFDDRYIYFKSALWWALEKMTKNTHAWPCTGICRNSQSILDNAKKARPTESSNKRDLHLSRRLGSNPSALGHTGSLELMGEQRQVYSVGAGGSHRQTRQSKQSEFFLLGPIGKIHWLWALIECNVDVKVHWI